MAEGHTIYEYAEVEMGSIVADLLDLATETHNFTKPDRRLWANPGKTEMLLCGKGYHIDDVARLPSAENAWLGSTRDPVQHRARRDRDPVPAPSILHG